MSQEARRIERLAPKENRAERSVCSGSENNAVTQHAPVTQGSLSTLQGRPWSVMSHLQGQ